MEDKINIEERNLHIKDDKVTFGWQLDHIWNSILEKKMSDTKNSASKIIKLYVL